MNLKILCNQYDCSLIKHVKCKVLVEFCSYLVLTKFSIEYVKFWRKRSYFHQLSAKQKNNVEGQLMILSVLFVLTWIFVKCYLLHLFMSFVNFKLIWSKLLNLFLFKYYFCNFQVDAHQRCDWKANFQFSLEMNIN